ncbi:MAG TPA: type VI secretion system contractile sheath large subunit [Phycisphaerae bacterium]|nr:type VI secretion system contractile sheath large subunit [Phycisphaerae bacterium]
MVLSVQQEAAVASGRRRVHIGYEVGPGDDERMEVVLPYAIGVLSDLSGDAAADGPPLEARRWAPADADSLPALLAHLRPCLALDVPNRLAGGGTLHVELAFGALEDFAPAGVVRQVEALRKAAGGTSPEARAAVCEQLNLILHHERFRRLEGAWRGLTWLAERMGADRSVRLCVLDVSKAELRQACEQWPGDARERGPLFERVYHDAFSVHGGEPLSVLVGDYDFDAGPADVELLTALGQAAAAAHAPLLAAAGAALFGMESWQQLAQRARPGQALEPPTSDAWQALRRSEAARYLALALPRFLARPAWTGERIALGLHFDEDTPAGNADRHVWCNAAYALAANVARSARRWGWPARIRGFMSGGLIESLPTATFLADHGKPRPGCPTEVALTERREAELDRAGLLPLSHWKGTDSAVFFGAQGLHEPAPCADQDATVAATLGSRLPYLLAACRFAHYLKRIALDAGDLFEGPDHLQECLNRWLSDYVGTPGDDADEAEADTARRPLAFAEVRVGREFTVPAACHDRRRYYAAELLIQPRHQLEGLSAPLRLSLRLPAPPRP